MTDLIARLEVAEGPSRKLDWDIASEFGFKQGRTTIPLRVWRGGMPSDLPRYTESIDAALSLLPKGHMWTVGFQNVGDTKHYVGPVSYCWRPRNTKHLHSTRAFTPALALLIAILKARQGIDRKG